MVNPRGNDNSDMSLFSLQVRDGMVIFQEDRFAIPSWDILLSAIAPWLPFLAEPAPPIEVLRKQIRSSEQ